MPSQMLNGDSELLTPIVSPALSPTVSIESLMLNDDHFDDILTPLSSPAIDPQVVGEFVKPSTFLNFAPLYAIPEIQAPVPRRSTSTAHLEEIFEERRSYHKNAEKRRRDTMKQYFELVRSILMPSQKNVSKLDVMAQTVQFVQSAHARELKMQKEIDDLKRQLNMI